MKNLFRNIDVFAVLQNIVGRHVKNYQSDFEIDKEIILKASEYSQSDDPKHSRLLWLAYPNGTNCFIEADVYVKDTYPYNAWVFYGEQTRDPIVAYAIELQPPRFDGEIIGDLYELDYNDHYRRVQKHALPRELITQQHTHPIDRAKWEEVLADAQADRDKKNYKIYGNSDYTSAWQYRPKTNLSTFTKDDVERIGNEYDNLNISTEYELDFIVDEYEQAEVDTLHNYKDGDAFGVSISIHHNESGDFVGKAFANHDRTYWDYETEKTHKHYSTLQEFANFVIFEYEKERFNTNEPGRPRKQCGSEM